MQFFRRLYYLLNRRKLDRALQDDMQFHREMMARDHQKDFGNPSLLREHSHEVWGWGWLDRLFQDIRFGGRLLRKSPGLAFTAITVLALGIGANVTAFNIVDVFYFKPLPVRDPQSLVRFTSESPESATTEVAYPAAMFYRDNNQVLASVIAQRWSNMTLSQTTSETVRTGLVSGNYFTEIGANAAYGRLFSAASDEAPDSPPVAVLSYGFWQRHFGSDASVVGSTIRLNQHPATVIGVLPFQFAGLDPEEGEHDDVWLLIRQEPYFVPESKVLTSFDDRESNVHMWGRLKPGVTRAQATQALLAPARQLVRDYSDLYNKGEHLRAFPATADHIDGNELPLFGVFAALVLLILANACGNLGNLLLGHAATREREMTIRLSLGATRGRIVRQVMTESLILAAIASTASLLISWWASRAVVAAMGGAGNYDFTPDWRTVLFAFAIGLLACVLFSLPSARQLSRRKPRTSRTRTILVGVQVAASCVLLVVSGLLVRAMQRALTVDPGFDYKHVLTVDPALYAHAYKPAASMNYLQELERRVQQMPGVDSTTLVTCPPFGNRASLQPARGELKVNVYFNEVTPNFFRTMSIPLLQGRDFTKDDHDVVIVSESYARAMFAGKDPLQQTHKLGGKRLPIIGVAGNARAVGMRDGSAAEIYLPLSEKSLNEAVMLVRTTLRPEDAMRPIEDTTRSIDPVVNPQVAMVKDSFNEKVGISGKIAGIIGGMGILALLLAMVGLYGVVSYNVVQRTREIGIRVALGATPSRIVRNMVDGFLLPLSIALAAGIALAAVLSLVLRSELYGLSNFDPLSYLAAVVLLLAIGSLAALVPARRALRVDPVMALRHE